MTDSEDEQALVEAAQRNPSEFAALYERHFERVYAFVLSRVADRDAAEDLTADVFHRALAALPRFEWRGAPFGAWLIRIAANAIADRRARGGREIVDDQGEGGPGRSPARGPEGLHSRDRAVEDFEERARLFRCVDELPADQRAVIVERFAHERSIRDVAARLGKSEGAVKQLQLRAIRALRLKMGGGRG